VKHLPRVGLVESALPNGRLLRLSSRGDDWVSNQVFWRGWAGYEPETIGAFFSLAERSECTIDVGAHVGLYALLAAHAAPAGRVLAIEPVPATLQRLRRNVALNGLQNVECLGVAASDAAGEATMHIPRNSLIPCSAGISAESFRSWADKYSAIVVKTETLDRLVEARSFHRVDLLKIDTEGTEACILRGSRRVLQEHRPTIICEVLEGAYSPGALETLLVPLGYRFELLTPDGPLLRARIEPHPVYWNFLCTAR
jgi:FkbM family methyltransferase